MFNLFKNPNIRSPISGICRCGHKWSWHYIDSNDNICYAHKILDTSVPCLCKGYKE